MKPIKFFFGPLFAIGKLHSLDLFFSRLGLALLNFMQIAVPIILIFCSIIILKAFFQAVLGLKNNERKITFVTTLSLIFFSILSLHLFLNPNPNKAVVILFGLTTIGFTLIFPSILGLCYLYNIMFCCEEAKCSRNIFSLHPSKWIFLALSCYLLLGYTLLVQNLQGNKLFEQNSKTTKITKTKN